MAGDPFAMIEARSAGEVMTSRNAPSAESDAIRERYARREGVSGRYSLFNPAALKMLQERQRALIDLLADVGWRDAKDVRLLEVGCGTGGNLLDLLRLGFSPENLTGLELLEARAAAAGRTLPASVRILVGDAASGPVATEIAPGSQDIVYQATVFSSVLDDAFQEQLAAAMWRWARPGGGILWYDFTVGNPRNPDVRGVPVARIRQLFPGGSLRVRRVTLAPPIARAVTQVHPALYDVFNVCRWLRTHVICWIQKPL